MIISYTFTIVSKASFGQGTLGGLDNRIVNIKDGPCLWLTNRMWTLYRSGETIRLNKTVNRSFATIKKSRNLSTLVREVQCIFGMNVVRVWFINLGVINVNYSLYARTEEYLLKRTLRWRRFDSQPIKIELHSKKYDHMRPLQGNRVQYVRW